MSIESCNPLNCDTSDWDFNWIVGVRRWLGAPEMLRRIKLSVWRGRKFIYLWPHRVFEMNWCFRTLFDNRGNLEIFEICGWGQGCTRWIYQDTGYEAFEKFQPFHDKQLSPPETSETFTVCPIIFMFLNSFLFRGSSSGVSRAVVCEYREKSNPKLPNFCDQTNVKIACSSVFNRFSCSFIFLFFCIIEWMKRLCVYLIVVELLLCDFSFRTTRGRGQ